MERWAILLAAIGAVGCQKPSAETVTLPFEWTNIVHEPSAFRQAETPETLIVFSNLVSFSHQEEKIEMGLGTADYEISVFFDRTNRTVRKILQQTSVGTNRFWLVDSDGDGLPEERRKFGEKGPEVLFMGEWHSARGLWNDREAMVAGAWTKVRFENGRWRKVEENK